MTPNQTPNKKRDLSTIKEAARKAYLDAGGLPDLFEKVFWSEMEQAVLQLLDVEEKHLLEPPMVKL